MHQPYAFAPPFHMHNYNYETLSIYPSMGHHSPAVHSKVETVKQKDVNIDPKTITNVSEKSPNMFWAPTMLAVILFILLVSTAVIVPLVVLHRSTKSKNVNGTTSSTSIALTMVTTTTTVTGRTTLCSSIPIATMVMSSSLPAQCTAHTVITDNSRNVAVSVANYTCDQSGPMTAVGSWFRFSGGAGTMLASCVIPIYRCSAHAPGWYSGIHPSMIGATVNGTVCYHWNSNTCNWSDSILVTNCNGFYVYFLRTPPICTLRYCTV